MQYVCFRLTTNISGHFHSFGKIINKDFITNSLHPFQLKHKLTLLCLGFDLNIGYDNGLEVAFKENNNCN